MQRIGRIVGIIALVAVIAFLVYFFVQRNQAVQSEPAFEIVRQATVARERIAATVNASGTIEPEALVTLGFRASGTIESVNVVRGQTVSPGDVMADVGADELRLAIRQAEDALRIQELSLQQALNAAPSTATLASAQADIDAAEANVIVAQGSLAASEANLTSAEAGVAQAVAAKNQLLAGPAEADVEAAQAEVDVRRAEYELAEEDYESLLQAEIAGRPELGARLTRNSAEAALKSAEARLAALVAPARAADIAAADAAIASAAAAVDAAAAQVTSSQGNLAAAEANVARARAAYDRLLEGPTDDEIALLEANVASAQTNLELAQLRLAQAQIIAPTAGVVASVSINAGEQATPGTPVITILNEAAFHLEVNVDEIDIDRIELGQPADITLDALEAVTLRGDVADIAPVAAQGSGGVVTYLVTINILDDQGVALRAGMTANAAVIVEEIDDVLVVPNWAIRLDRETGGAFVNRLAETAEGEKVEEVPIATGLRNEQASEVLSGLDVGDVVVVTNERESFSLFGR